MTNPEKGKPLASIMKRCSLTRLWNNQVGRTKGKLSASIMKRYSLIRQFNHKTKHRTNSERLQKSSITFKQQTLISTTKASSRRWWKTLRMRNRIVFCLHISTPTIIIINKNGKNRMQINIWIDVSRFPNSSPIPR